MIRVASKWMAVFVLGLGIAVGGATAQESAEQPSPSELTADENLDLIDEDIEGLSDREKLDRAAGKVDGMRDTLAEVDELLELAREQERDIIKINCINEKHAAIKGFVKVSEQSYVNLEEAVDDGDTSAAEHHYTLIAVAGERVQSLAEEARLCTGEEQRFAGDTDLEVTEPDTADGEFDGPDEEFAGEDLPELTPFQ